VEVPVNYSGFHENTVIMSNEGSREIPEIYWPIYVYCMNQRGAVDLRPCSVPRKTEEQRTIRIHCSNGMRLVVSRDQMIYEITEGFIRPEDLQPTYSRLRSLDGPQKQYTAFSETTVLFLEYGPTMDLYEITVDSGNIVANGLVARDSSEL